MYLVVTLTSAGTDTGPFNIYSNVDDYTNAFEVNVDKDDLLAGFATDKVPDGTSEIRVKSTNSLCNNEVSAPTVPLEYYFVPRSSVYVVDALDKNTFAYVYGYFTGYYDGYYLNPGNHLIKVLPNGSLSPDFDIQEGFNQHPLYTNTTMYEQPDGKVLIAGYFTSFNGESANRIIRLNTDGSRDYSFNIGTGFNDFALSVVEDLSNRFYVTGLYSRYNGSYSPRLVRLLNDGSLDTSFNVGNGFTNTTLNMVIQEDNSLVLTHYPSSYNNVPSPAKIIRILPDASPDLDFIANAGTGFNAGTNQPTMIRKIRYDERIYCAGYFTSFNGNPAGGVCRILPDGNFDSTFNVGGAGFLPIRSSQVVIVIWENKLLISGNFSSYNGEPTYGWVIINQDGSIYLTFTVVYFTMYTIGNILYGQTETGNNEPIHTYTP